MYTRDYDYVHWFEQGCRYYRLSGYTPSGPAAVAGLSAYVCRVNVPDRGEIEKYIEANSGMVSFVTESLGGCFAGLDDLAWAEYFFFKTDTASAEQFAYQALRKAQEANQYEIENRALFYLFRISIYHGSYDKLGDFENLLEAQLSRKDYLNRYIYYDIFMSSFYLQTGQPGKVSSWLKSDVGESGLNSLASGLDTLIRIKYLFYEGRYQAALAAMANQKGIYGYVGFLFGKIIFKVLEALCRYRLEDIPGSIKALEAAYELASPNGLDMSFIELKDTQYLIGGILKGGYECSIPREWLERIQRAASAYAKKVFVAAQKYGGKDQHSRYSGGLSRREMTVLTGLSQGLTREELADDNDISVNTVKSVIKSVYGKLGAVNRADAVRIAAEKGILKLEA